MSSYHFDSEDGEESTSEDESVTSLQKSGLSLTQKKQLIGDILKTGGLDNCCVRLIREEKPDIYGLDRKTKRQIENAVTYWRGRGRGEFDTLTLTYFPSSQEQSSSSKPSRSGGASLGKKHRPPIYTPPRSRSIVGQVLQQPQTHNSPIPNSVNMLLNRKFVDSLLANRHHKITITKEDPEFNNGIFYVYFFTDHHHNNKAHNGYHIELKDLDVRFTMGAEALISAWHVGGNQVFVKAPSGTYTFLYDGKAEDDARKKSKYTHARSLEANNITHNAILTEKHRHFNYYLLVFPDVDSHVGFNNDIFSPGADNGKIEPHVSLVKSDFTIDVADGKKKVEQMRVNISWDIAEFSTETRAVGPVQESTNELDTKISSLFSSMSI
jgi:hypothetical protein